MIVVVRAATVNVRVSIVIAMIAARPVASASRSVSASLHDRKPFDGERREWKPREDSAPRADGGAALQSRPR